MNIYKVLEDANGDNFNIRVNNKLNILKNITEKEDQFEIKAKNNGKILIIDLIIKKDYPRESKIAFVIDVNITKIIGNGERKNINNLIITQEKNRATINTTKSEEYVSLSDCTSKHFLNMIVEFLKDNNVYSNSNLVEGIRYILPLYGVYIDHNLNSMFLSITDYIKYLERKKNEISNSNLKYAFSNTLCNIVDEIDYLKEYYELDNNVLKK